MSDERIDVELVDKIAPTIARNIAAIATEARAADTALERLRGQLGGLSAAATLQNRINTTNATAALRQQQLATAVQRTAIAQANLTAAQARAASAQLRLQNLQNGTNGALTRYTALLQRVIPFLASFFGIRASIEAGNEYLNLSNKLQLVAQNGAQAKEIMKQLFDVAKETRQPIDDVATLFQRLDLALIQMGSSQKETIGITRTLSQAIAISGLSTMEQAQGLRQISQAFNKGKLDGDEFRTVMETMPVVADALAKRLNVTRGELLKLAPQGKITAQVMRDALVNAAAGIEDRFKKTAPTINQALTNLQTNFIEFMGRLNASTGIFTGLATVILLVANNLDTLAVALATVGVALIIYFGPNLLAMFRNATTAVRIFTAAIAANPLGALAVGLTALVAWLAVFKDSILIGVDSVTTLGDLLKSIWIEGIESGQKFVSWLTGIFVPVITFVSENVIKPLGFVFDRVFEGIRIITAANLAVAGSVGDATGLGDIASRIVTRAQELAKARTADGSSTLRGAGPNLLPPPIDKNAVKRADLLAKENRELDTQLKSLVTLQPQREVMQQLDRIDNELLSRKLDKLNPQERKDFEGRIKNMQELIRFQRAIDNLYNENEGAVKDLGAAIFALDRAYRTNIISLQQYREQYAQLGLAALKLKLDMGKGNFNDTLLSGLGSIIENYKGMLPGLATSFGNFFNSLASGFANTIGQVITGTKTLKEGLHEIATTALSELISGLVKLGLQWVIMHTLGASLSAAAVAVAGTEAAALAAAWAPAAAMASLATLGSNAAPAAAGLASVNALAQTLALPYALGFANGGMVMGPGGPRSDSINARLSSGEYVVNAFATARHRDLLDMINYGRASANDNGFANGGYVGSRGGVVVSIENYGTSKAFDVQQISADEVRIIARDEAETAIHRRTPNVIAAEIRDPNSRTSKAFGNFTSLERRRGG